MILVRVCFYPSDALRPHVDRQGLAQVQRGAGERGELNLDSSVVEEWKGELKKANKGKVGEPYHYPESYIRFLAFVRLLFHQPYRQTEGFVKSLPSFVDWSEGP